MRHADNASDVARFARVLRWVSMAAGGFYVASTLVALLAWSGWGSRLVSATLDTAGLPPAWAAGIAALLAALTAAAMWQLAQMLARIGSGQVFSAEVIRRFRSFCLLFLLVLLVRSVLPAAVALLLALQAGAGPVRLAFDGGEIITLVIAALLYLVARLFEHAARWEDDSRSIV